MGLEFFVIMTHGIRGRAAPRRGRGDLRDWGSVHVGHRQTLGVDGCLGYLFCWLGGSFLLILRVVCAEAEHGPVSGDLKAAGMVTGRVAIYTRSSSDTPILGLESSEEAALS